MPFSVSQSSNLRMPLQIFLHYTTNQNVTVSVIWSLHVSVLLSNIGVQESSRVSPLSWYCNLKLPNYRISIPRDPKLVLHSRFHKFDPPASPEMRKLNNIRINNPLFLFSSSQTTCTSSLKERGPFHHSHTQQQSPTRSK